MTAVKTSWRQSMPEFLQLLDGTLGHKVKLHREVLGYDLYLVDLSDWKLRFSDRTPLIFVKEADLAEMSARDLAQGLTDLVRAQSLAERNSILVVEGPGDALKEQLRATYQPLLVLDATDVRAIRESRRPSGELLDRLAPQLDLSLLTPYETSKPVTGSRFFGREFEVRRILQTPDSNFAIMGIRRIGKTSLMREIERQLRERWGDPELLRHWAPSAADDPDVQRWWSQLMRWGAGPGLATTMMEMYRSLDVRPLLPLVRVPSLILWREGDRLYLFAGRFVHVMNLPVRERRSDSQPRPDGRQ